MLSDYDFACPQVNPIARRRHLLTTNLLTFARSLTRGLAASWAFSSNMALRFLAVSREGMASSSMGAPGAAPLSLMPFWRASSTSHFSNLARSCAAFLALCGEQQPCKKKNKQSTKVNKN